MGESDLSAFKARESSRGKALKLTKTEPLEADIQSAILHALKIHPAVAWSGRFNSGAQVIGEGKARRFVRFSTVKGLSDIVGQMVDGRMLAIEVKRPSGRVTEDQKSFIGMVQNSNGVAFVARSVADVFAVLDGELRR
jgi:hypothetical protein